MLSNLKHCLFPILLQTDEEDVYSTTIQRLESRLEDCGIDKESFVPLKTIVNNAKLYGPQYKITAVLDGATIATGSINRRAISFVCNDPVPSVLLDRIVEYARGVPGATVEWEDNLGNPLF
jgi:hypothetical protein